MTRRTSGLAVALMTAGSIGLLASPALAQERDRDCPDFPSQAAAQRHLQSQPSDPDRLDADNDGIACETHFGGGSRIEEDENNDDENNNDETNNNNDDDDDNNDDDTPNGGVAAGAGGTAGPASAVLPATGALAGTVLIGAGVAAARRRTS